MNTTLGAEIKQKRAFASLEQEVFLNLVRTSALLEHALAESMKQFAITQTQYNVLRILRGAGDGGLCRHEIRDRMITPVPDVTRLLDRLEERGLVVRERDTVDRRLVTARITADGGALLARMDGPTDRSIGHHLGHLSQAELKRLRSLLEKARERV